MIKTFMVFMVGIILGILLVSSIAFPCNVLIEVHEAEQMVLSLESPKDFNGTQSIELVFTPSYYSEIGPSYSINIELHYP